MVTAASSPPPPISPPWIHSLERKVPPVRLRRVGGVGCRGWGGGVGV